MTHESEHNRLYREASSLVFPAIELVGRKPLALDSAVREQLKRGIDLFDEVLPLNPQNWAAMWMVGKAYQRLKNTDMAFSYFARAHAVKPDHPDVAREASIAAMELGRPAEAIPYCERAIAARPQDPGLRANLALALLFSGLPEQAESIASDAQRRDPSDQITARIIKLCREVQSGKRVCPRHVRDVL